MDEEHNEVCRLVGKLTFPYLLLIKPEIKYI